MREKRKVPTFSRKVIILEVKGRDRGEMKTHHKRLTFGKKL